MKKDKEVKGIIYYIFSINVVFDIITGFFPIDSTLAIIRAGFLYSLLLLLFVKYRKEKSPNYFIPILFLYFLILVNFSSNQFLSIKVVLQVFASIMLFPIGYYIVKDIKTLKLFNRDILRVSFLLIFNSLFSTLFGYGYSYSNKQMIATGNIVGHALLILVYVVIIIYFMVITSKKKAQKSFYIVILITLILIVIFSLIRTVMLTVLIGILIFKYYEFKEKKTSFVLKSVVFSMFLFILIISPFGGNFIDKVDSQFSIRDNRLSSDGAKNELRYEETFLVWNKVLSFKDIKTSLFGNELFNSMGRYANWTFGDRQVHVDYNNIVFGSGLLGLLLYLLIYLKILKKFLYYKKNINLSGSLFFLQPLFYAFFINSLLISFSGQMYGISFRSVNFFYMGAILGILNNIYLYDEK